MNEEALAHWGAVAPKTKNGRKAASCVTKQSKHLVYPITGQEGPEVE